MCGFLGQFGGNGGAIEVERLNAALDTIAHRGPDDRATASGTGWWMGFRRLAILDLSAKARQPMEFGSGRFTLVFNGEIYNYRELREELGGGDFVSSGDSEVLGRMLMEKGVEATLRKLRGMFAFAWWDAKERRLELARDPFGIKPLYYRLADDGTLTVASELRAIRAAAGADELKMSARALVDCLRWGSVQSPETVYEGVRSLEPGCSASWAAGGGGVRVSRYFAPRWEREREWITDEEELAERVRHTVVESVRAHLISDVPVGIFLSGGLDSSILCGAMREAGVERIEAFSIGYEGDAGLEDESDAAEATAKHYGAVFRADKISAADLYESFGNYLRHLDAPTGDALNVYLVARAASKHVKVALSGTGADEMFAGYNHYRMMKIAHRLPFFRALPEGLARRTIEPLFARLPQAMQVNRAVRTAAFVLGANGRSAEQMYLKGKSILRPEAIAELLPGGAEGMAGRDAEAAEEARAAGPDSWLHRVLYLESTRYLPNTLLRDTDDMTMAHSLELRVPFVDSQIMALSARTPPEAMLGIQHGKRVLREAFRDTLPPWILEDRKKKTFTLPLMRWLRQPQWRDRVYDVLGSSECRHRGLFLPEGVERHLAAFYASSDESKRNFAYSQRVWQMFVMESWARENATATIGL